MAKKVKSRIEKSLEELILRTVKDATDGKRSPGAEKIQSIARLLNSYGRLRGGSPGKIGGSLTSKLEGMSETERYEYYAENGMPNAYEEMDQ